MTVAAFDVLPSLSPTVYWMGAGSLLKPGIGVKVMEPVAVLMLHVPSPGTTRATPGAGVPTICAQMLDALTGTLEGGAPLLSETIGSWVQESAVADILRRG